MTQISRVLADLACCGGNADHTVKGNFDRHAGEVHYSTSLVGTEYENVPANEVNVLLKFECMLDDCVGPDSLNGRVFDR